MKPQTPIDYKTWLSNLLQLSFKFQGIFLYSFNKLIVFDVNNKNKKNTIKGKSEKKRLRNRNFNLTLLKFDSHDLDT